MSNILSLVREKLLLSFIVKECWLPILSESLVVGEVERFLEVYSPGKGVFLEATGVEESGVEWSHLDLYQIALSPCGSH